MEASGFCSTCSESWSSPSTDPGDELHRFRLLVVAGGLRVGGGDVCDLHHCELFSAAKEGLVEFRLGRVRGIFRFDVTFNGDAIEWTPHRCACPD